MGNLREIFLEDVESLLLLGQVFLSRKVEFEVPARLSDGVENFMLHIRPVGDEFLSHRLIRDLCAAQVDEDRERSFTRYDSVVSPVDCLVHNFPGNVACLIEEKGDFVGEPEENYLSLGGNVF